MNLLITGSTGFLGRNLLLKALESDLYEKIYLPVRNIKKLQNNLKTDGLSIDHPKLVIFEGNHLNWNLPKEVRFDHVIHTAGVISANSRQSYFEINTEGTHRLFENLNENSKTLVISSQAAGGPCPEHLDKRSEDLEDSPINPYGESKLAMEKEVQERYPNRAVLFFRPPMILGPRDQASLPLFQMVKSPLRVKPGLCKNQYSFIHVDDLVNACFLALKESSQWASQKRKQFYLCSEEVITDSQLMQSAAKVSNRKKGLLLGVPYQMLWGAALLVHSVPPLKGKIPTLNFLRINELKQRKWTLTAKEFSSAFNWKTQSSFQKTLKETHDWYQSQKMI